jgi:hypothetical protein
MPNVSRRNKNRSSAFRVSPRRGTPTGTHSVKDLLGGLTRVTDQAARQTAWRRWLEEHLPAGLAAHLSGVVEREGALVIFAESAAWSARLRYAVHELESRIRAHDPAITTVSVRVLPKA